MGVVRYVRQYSSETPPHAALGLPALSPTMETGGILEWNKKEGEQVTPGEVIATISSDKAAVSWESIEDGYIAKVLVPEGTTDIPVGKPVAILVEEQSDIAFFKDWKVEDCAWKPSMDAPADETAQVEAEAAKKAEERKAKEQELEQKAQEQKASAASSTKRAKSGGRAFASPLARKLAQEQGVDVAALQGSGPGGRVVAADVEGAPVAAAAASRAMPVSQTASGGGSYVDIPNSQIRKITAERLTESKQTIPHYYLAAECNVDKLMALRTRLNSKADGAYKVSVNDFVVKASAVALQRVPGVNAQWNGVSIRRFSNIDINVAINTENGLMTPVVRAVDSRGLVAISDAVKDLAAKARAMKLAPADFEGGTFTISNLGMFGLSHFSAVINPPQAAILAVGGLESKVIVDREQPADSPTRFRESATITVTLSCDHRVIDGAQGAEWLQHFKKVMEDPIEMIL